MKKMIAPSQLHKAHSASIILITSISAITIYSLFNLKKTFYNQFLADLHITNTELGILFALYGIACTLSYLPGGIVGDRIPMKILSSGSLLIVAGLMFWVATTPPFPLLCFIFFLYGISAGLLFWSCRYKLIRLVTVDENNYGKNISWSYFLGALTGITGNILLTIVYVQFLQNTGGFVKMIGICGIVNLCMGLICFFTIPYFENELRDANHRMPRLGLFKNFRLILCSVIMFLVYSLYSLEYVTTAYLQNIFFASTAVAAGISTIRNHGVNLAANPIMGYLSRRFSASSVIKVSALILTGVFGILSMIPHRESLLIPVSLLIILFGFLINGVYGITSALLVEIKTPTHQFASTIGIFSLIGFLPDAIFPPIVGVILDRFGAMAYQYMNLTFLGLSVLIWICTSLLFRHVD